ncbi:hypothetical protein JQ554_33360 [Bradyrhizobium diazoefficiens]|nr:hypothetical protein [Bradyrhizobium diazoefficiens]MBR0967875.1 hypothetical protein [Bradyrhizobium diazoefficiens]MBR0981269.1 hypothetical protein [Bradyrhizobium diazoefficiens]MBR1010726.1 hypothetical protein [Bradyrhizobium diazoefficiens]MBR1018238.1 hypothetical protein [Bradyrhizobium diazoefficiens]MBR1055566.1 hypothetical protein [Bradyrhizobium diazoefficiens]
MSKQPPERPLESNKDRPDAKGQRTIYGRHGQNEVHGPRLKKGKGKRGGGPFALFRDYRLAKGIQRSLTPEEMREALEGGAEKLRAATEARLREKAHAYVHGTDPLAVANINGGSTEALEFLQDFDYTEEIPTKELKDEGELNASLLQFFKDENLPPAMWSDTAAEIRRLVQRKRAAAVERPLWDDRANHPELANLSAPQFLKRVWADQIAPDGTIEKEMVRKIDRSLMAKVDGYLSTRERRQQDAGDAAGLRFVARRTRPKGVSLG